MLKEQLLKKFSVRSPRFYYFAFSIVIFLLCLIITFCILLVDDAAKWAAIDNQFLSDLINIDLYQTYKGSTIIAMHILSLAITHSLYSVLLFTIMMWYIPRIVRKQREFLALIYQLPDEI